MISLSSSTCVCVHRRALAGLVPRSVLSECVLECARVCVMRPLLSLSLSLSVMKKITLFPSVLTCFVHMCCIHQLSEREKIVGFKGLSLIGPLFHHRPACPPAFSTTRRRRRRRRRGRRGVRMYRWAATSG